jgi:hypothetical protein
MLMDELSMLLFKGQFKYPAAKIRQPYGLTFQRKLKKRKKG